jgi:hypothetical protein
VGYNFHQAVLAKETFMEFRHISPPIRRAVRELKYRQFVLLPDDAPLIDQLPLDHQNVLRSEGTYAERAEKLGIPIGTLRSRLHRARDALLRLRGERNGGRPEAIPSSLH